MKPRSIKQVFAPKAPHFVGNGFLVHNFIPAYDELSMQRMSPFVLLDYNAKFYFSPTGSPRGVGPHPHRGFETVTIAYKGKVAHHDSMGNGGVIADGDVQWMTAGGGILHKEYHEANWAQQGGELHMVQLWVNLPAKDKMTLPKYQGIVNKDIKYYPLANESKVEVIAGDYNGVSGAASTFTPMNVFNLYLKSTTDCKLTFPMNYNTVLLVVEGRIKVNDRVVECDNLVLMANDGEEFVVTADEDSIVLVLSGEPINEPIAAKGPFVMNTQAELIKAYYDFNSGKFSELE